ncbi:MAG: glycosyl transferase family 1, partial [Cyanobacteria bacterium]|nr:glycosyl transferase family 1 [Cyanobacteriota bacterium]
MPKGNYPFAYLQDPYINSPIESIYQDLDDFTDEIFQDEPHLYPNIDHFTILPPLYHEGVFVKGLMLCRGV